MKLPKINIQAAQNKDRTSGNSPSRSTRLSLDDEEPSDDENPLLLNSERKRSKGLGAEERRGSGVQSAKEIENPYLKGAADPVAYMHETGSVSARAAPHLQTLRARSFRASVSSLLPKRLPSLAKGENQKFEDYMMSFYQEGDGFEEDEDKSPKNRQSGVRLSRREEEESTLSKDAWLAAKNVLSTSRMTQKDESGNPYFIDRYTGRKVWMAPDEKRRVKSKSPPRNPRKTGLQSVAFAPQKPAHSNQAATTQAQEKTRDGFLTSRARRVQKIREQLMAEKLQLEEKLNKMQKALSEIHHGQQQFHDTAQEAAVQEKEAIGVSEPRFQTPSIGPEIKSANSFSRATEFAS